jgi:mono/diheme cytochrome c family protein
MTNINKQIDLSADICTVPEHSLNPEPMKTTKIILLAAVVSLLGITACGGGTEQSGPPGASGPAPTGGAAGDGRSKANMITAADITLGDIDQGMVEKGRSTYDVKCQACHSTGPNRVVGPGWKGLAERRKPEWIMNMMLNIDVMLETDEEAQRQLEECLVRMPNQGLSKTEGREVLEFIRTL